MVLVAKNLPASVGDVRDSGLISGSGRSPGGGHGHPLQYSCLGSPIDRGAWWAIVHVVAKSWTWLKWLSTCRHRIYLDSFQVSSYIIPLCIWNQHYRKEFLWREKSSKQMWCLLHFLLCSSAGILTGYFCSLNGSFTKCWSTISSGWRRCHLFFSLYTLQETCINEKGSVYWRFRKSNFIIW